MKKEKIESFYYAQALNKIALSPYLDPSANQNLAWHAFEAASQGVKMGGVWEKQCDDQPCAMCDFFLALEIPNKNRS